MNPVAVWRIRTDGDQEAMLVGGLGRHPEDGRPVLTHDGQYYGVGDLAPGSFIGVYFWGEVTRDAMNLLVEMRRSGWVICAVDARTEHWTGIEIPKFRVVGE
jgi:hypothetical protein